jgi:hypothetical protein
VWKPLVVTVSFGQDFLEIFYGRTKHTCSDNLSGMNVIYMCCSRTLTYNNISILNQNIYRLSARLKPEDVWMQYLTLSVPFIYYILHPLRINMVRAVA